MSRASSADQSATLDNVSASLQVGAPGTTGPAPVPRRKIRSRRVAAEPVSRQVRAAHLAVGLGRWAASDRSVSHGGDPARRGVEELTVMDRRGSGTSDDVAICLGYVARRVTVGQLCGSKHHVEGHVAAAVTDLLVAAQQSLPVVAGAVGCVN